MVPLDDKCRDQQVHDRCFISLEDVPTHAFTQPDAEGAFTIAGLPAGRFTLHVWHPDLAEVVREVEIPADGAKEVEVRL